MKLYKYLKKEYLPHWYNDGAIIFSPLQRFVKMESSFITADSYEGCMFYKAENLSVYFNEINISQDIVRDSYIRIRYHKHMECHIASFSKTYSQELKTRFQSECVLEFNFDDPLQEYLSNTRIQHGAVRYLEESPLHLSVQEKINRAIFTKRPHFCVEDEYRFVIPPFKSPSHNINKDFSSFTMFYQSTNLLKERMIIKS